MQPPAVSIDGEGAETRFDGVTQYRIDWPQVREIAVEVTAVPELGYSEAFWQLTGEGVEFGAPVELVVGAEEFNAKLFGFPGFDQVEYQRAREAETFGRPGRG